MVPALGSLLPRWGRWQRGALTEGALELTGPKETIRRAQSLRRAMSLPERILWRALRKQQIGLRFRRQHPAGPYVLDFYCDGAKLCVEVDGVVQHIVAEAGAPSVGCADTSP